VKSRIARTNRTLSPTSLYLPIEAQFTRRLTHSQAPGSVPPDVYARGVVCQLLHPPLISYFVPWQWPSLLRSGGGPGRRWIWKGNWSTTIWFLSGGWAWCGLWDWAMARTFGLSKLKEIIAQEKKRN
jgi:1-acylglycerone phosphate reductase